MFGSQRILGVLQLPLRPVSWLRPSPQAITTHLPGTLAGAFAALRAIVFHYDLAPDIAVFLDLQALIRVRRLAKESRLYDRQLKVEIAAEKRKAKEEWAEKKMQKIRMRNRHVLNIFELFNQLEKSEFLSL